MAKRNPSITIACAWCQAEVTKWPSQLKGKKHVFCSRTCQRQARSKTHNPNGYRQFVDTRQMSENMKRLNAELNPTRMTPEVKAKLRQARLGKGEKKTYQKIYGRHVHRVVAEQKVGRPLRSDEIVHHIDGDIHNNHPDNLQIVTRSEHIEIHRRQGDLGRKAMQ